MPPTSGAIRFKGHSIVGKKPSAIVSEGLVRTFQATTVFPDASVIENVMRGAFATTPVSMLSSVFNTRAARATLAATAERCGVLLDRLQLASYRDARAGELSYGGQRRLGVAIALAAKPELLMLDEPVAGLNPEEAAEFGRLIRRSTKPKVSPCCWSSITCGWSWDCAIASSCWTTARMIAEGIPVEIRANRKVIEAYLGSEEVG